MLVREIFLRKRRMPLFLCALQHFLGALQWKRCIHLAIRHISRQNTVVFTGYTVRSAENRDEAPQDHPDVLQPDWEMTLRAAGNSRVILKWQDSQWSKRRNHLARRCDQRRMGKVYRPARSSNGHTKTATSRPVEATARLPCGIATCLIRG
ncbi:hypothetical protein [Aurantimonas coralicida]|uniref:hypothetical protein n=1 Tax=Aurantimonas coralicida TaxID=182270 RepID=UPI001D183FF4|nr:hypothetical protein [Aurantimonas coralicida]MCC4297085.1 hypothetical protein [Aurantimonas coralicida]